MKAYIEHANLYVSSVDESARFLQTALPEFSIRGQGIQNGTKWAHIGTSSSYVALNETADRAALAAGRLNHIGFVVDDLAAIRARLLHGGYQEGFVSAPHQQRERLYFLDRDGLEWEFVQYFSDDPMLRNDYGE